MALGFWSPKFNRYSKVRFCCFVSKFFLYVYVFRGLTPDEILVEYTPVYRATVLEYTQI